MKLKPIKLAPLLVTVGVLIFICSVRLLDLGFFERLQDMTYDMRARAAARFPTACATNLAFVAITDSSIIAVQKQYGFGLYWPREVYGDLVHELAAEKAKSIAFDVMLLELRPDHPKAVIDGRIVTSDEYFARQMRQAGNVVLGVPNDATLPDLFDTNAMTLGDISVEKDSDGILRRVKAFYAYRHWNPLFQKAAAEFDLDLANATVMPGKIILPQIGTTNVVEIPVDAENDFDLTNFSGDKLPPGVAPKAKAFSDERVWQMGIVLAAQELKLDLAHADVDLSHHRIILHGQHGIKREIPVDSNGTFLINWRLVPNDPHLTQAPLEYLLSQNELRSEAETNQLQDLFHDKLVVVGSTASGNDLTDRGATPLKKDTFLVSTYWNVANSVITGVFIRRSSLLTEISLIILMGLLVAFITWQCRAAIASTAIIFLILAYIGVAFSVFVHWNYWLPLVFPVFGMLAVHISLVTYRVVFEEREQRRVKSIFSKIVSPEVVNELLQAQKFSLGGTQREMTVLFTDVRDFTALTDEMQERVSEFVRKHQLDPHAAAVHFDAAAREILNAVNVYLVLVANAVKKHNGTLDKYIGDCVMAFWGAPVENSKHALACVRAAIDAQRAIHKLNEERAAENQRRETENRARALANLPPKPLLPSQQLGTGINSGMMTVGLVGSEEHQYNYTVFGREVNLAARLEGVSGSGRIIISEATFQHLLRDDQDLAATCIPLPAVYVKGIRSAVKIYEVPWKENLKPIT